MKAKSFRVTRTVLATITCSLAFAIGIRGVAGESTDVAFKPDGKWKSYPTRTLDDLPPVVRTAEADSTDLYGGMVARKADATGVFHVTRVDGRWWLVDPAGGLFIHKGVVGVAQLRTRGAEAAAKPLFQDATDWANQTAAWLHSLGFNGLGAWSDTERLRATSTPLAYTKSWDFMSSYGRKRGGTYQQPGHTGYPNDCIFVFDPEFETYCDDYAKQLAATRGDPWLLGHFSDNELPFKREALTDYLTLPSGDPGRRAAEGWLRERHGPKANATDITDEDQKAFLGYVVERYFSIVGRAIRKYDPNHLFLGSRLNGAALRLPEVFKAAGRHLDVVAVNYYHAWSPEPELIAMWQRESGKPFLVTEWYAKALDAPGLANTGGAGWVVKTQRDRARFYENFTLGLLETRSCVGWHWFKYADNDPADTKSDPSNRDANKGMVSNRYAPYAELVSAMERINERSYRLIDYFDHHASGGHR
jgi:hypothetical protein